MIRCTLIAVLAVAAFTFSAAWAEPVQNQPSQTVQHKQMHKKMKKRKKAMHAAFLIQRKLPHYSKVLMKMWYDPKLGLNTEQKKKLKAIRTNTIRQVKEIAPQVKKLTHEIVKAARKGAKAETLYAKVDALASLKAKATKVHLECIEKTMAVLSPEQRRYLHAAIQKHHKTTR